jgi:DNA transformation protein and related proteins
MSVLSDEFLTYVADQLAPWGEISIRKMFGGAGLYRDETMFGLVADDTLYFKVDDTNRADTERAGRGPFKPHPDKPTVMSYYEVPPDVLESPTTLAQWAETSSRIKSRARRRADGLHLERSGTG